MVCRYAAVPGVRVLGQETLGAFGSAYWMNDTTRLEGPWLSTLFTAAILIGIGVSTLTPKTRPGRSLLRTVVGLYAVFTGLVEVAKVVFDVSRFALVLAAIHNLAEWGIVGHLLWTREGVQRHWLWSRLWVLFMVQGILYLPSLFAAGAWEQLCCIWCDWLLVTCFALRYHELRSGNEDEKALSRNVFSWGLAGACLHLAGILPLVWQLAGVVKPPFAPFATVVALVLPVTMYWYHCFALAWDRQEEQATCEGAPREAGHTNGNQAVIDSPSQLGGHTGGRVDRSSAKGSARAMSPYHQYNTSTRRWLLLYIGCFLLGTATIMGPMVIFPLCDTDGTVAAASAGDQQAHNAMEADCLSAGQAAAARVTQYYSQLARDPASGYRQDPLLAQGVPRVSDMMSPGGSDGGHLQWVDLVMAGGGMFGIAEAGYTNVLEQLGIRFHSVAGTSAGAINAELAIALRDDPSQPSSGRTLHAIANAPFVGFMDGPGAARMLTKWLLSGSKPAQASAPEPDVPSSSAKGMFWAVRAYVALPVALALLAAAASLVRVPPSVARPLAAGLLLVAALGCVATLGTHLAMSAMEREGLHQGTVFKSWMSEQLRRAVSRPGEQLTAEQLRRPVTLAEFQAKLQLDNITFQVFDQDKLKSTVRARTVQGSVHTDFRLSRLALVAADVTTETLAEFPKHTHLYYADPAAAPVADFVRGSMSVPGFFQPHVVKDIPQGPQAEAAWAAGDDYHTHSGEWRPGVDYHPKAGLPKDVTFVDGGLLSNFPIAVFHQRDRVPLRPTFGVTFGGNSTRHLRSAKDDQVPFLSTPNTPRQSAASLLFSCVDTARQILDREFIVRNPDYKQLVTAIDTGGAGQLDFYMPDKQKVDLCTAGADAAAEFLIEFDWEKYKQTRTSLLHAKQTADNKEECPAPSDQQLSTKGAAEEEQPKAVQEQLPAVSDKQLSSGGAAEKERLKVETQGQTRVYDERDLLAYLLPPTATTTVQIPRTKMTVKVPKGTAARQLVVTGLLT